MSRGITLADLGPGAVAQVQKALARETTAAAPRGRRRRPEDELQRSIVHWAGWAVPPLDRGGALVFAIANGGWRSRAEARILKGLGVVAGMPDLAVVLPGGRIALAELKAPSGVLTVEQEEIRDACRAAAVPWAELRSVEGFAAFLVRLGVPLRTRAVGGP